MAVFRRRSGFSASTPLKCGIRTRGSPAVANGLAVTSLKRSPIISELPTLAESGFPDFEAISWFGLLAPAGTPAAVVGKVHADIVQIAVRADMRERIAQLGLEPIDHLVELGVTAVQLMPVMEYDEDTGNVEGRLNHWGYMTTNFFAPESRYAAVEGQQIVELKELVRTPFVSQSRSPDFALAFSKVLRPVLAWLDCPRSLQPAAVSRPWRLDWPWGRAELSSDPGAAAWRGTGLDPRD
jgi:Tripartite tricarboxylate transporter family receptor